MARSVYRHVREINMLGCAIGPDDTFVIHGADGEWVVEGEDALPLRSLLQQIQPLHAYVPTVKEFLLVYSAVARRIDRPHWECFGDLVIPTLNSSAFRNPLYLLERIRAR